MDKQLKELESALGHDFVNPEILVRALTHRSLAHELAQENGIDPAAAPDDNERLEFLGDAVLTFVVSVMLADAFPDWEEGKLTRARAHLVALQGGGHSIRPSIERGIVDAASIVNQGGVIRPQSGVCANEIGNRAEVSGQKIGLNMRAGHGSGAAAAWAKAPRPAMFFTSSAGNPCRACRYSGSL